jgi:hypothetical protein
MATDGDVPIVFYIRQGHIDAPKQVAALLKRGEERGYRLVSICSRPEDCAAAVTAGAARIVLAVDEDRVLVDLVEAAGGRVEALRAPQEPPRRGAGLSMSAVLRRLCGRGKTPSQIAEILETTTGEITTALRRLGYRPK